MSTLTTFVYDDPRIDSSELASRIHPQKTRQRARDSVNRALHNRPTSPEGKDTAAALHAQVQQLAADLREALAVPAAAGLVPMALDPRIKGQALAVRVFHMFTASTAASYWKMVRDGNKKLEYGQRIILRAALTELAEACENAIK